MICRVLSKKIIDLLLYSNFFIAACAVAMSLQTDYLLRGELHIDYLTGLIFFCTLLIYALHRLIGLKKVSEFLDVERFKVISEKKSHIWFYAIIAALGSAVCFLMVSNQIRLALVIPGIVSLLYVLPLLGGSKRLRLRDFDMIKIYLIAGVWSYVTVFLPALDAEKLNLQTLLMFVERGLFIFAITLPFDIRDLVVDQHTEVNTIPGKYGVKTTLRIVAVLLVIFTVLSLINYPIQFALGLILSAVITYSLVKIASTKKHDYWYSGVLDGTMIIQFSLVVGFGLLLLN